MKKINFKSWKNKAAVLCATLLIGLAGLLPFLAPTPVAAATTYIYATFHGDAAADEKLWIYQSTNGTSFSQLYATGFGGSTGVLRDPSIMKHTDGNYYVAYTVYSWDHNSTYFSIARSSNLQNWTQIASVNSGISNTRHTWAPEWFKDGSTVKIIASVDQTTCSACFRPYVYTAQNSALTSWSGPAGMGWGINRIDTFVVKSGTTYHAFAKNETTKYIEHLTSSNLTSGWSYKGTLWSSGYEGPAVINAGGTWRIYVDKYTNGGIWTATSSDLNSWSGLSQITCPACRHGTIIVK